LIVTDRRRSPAGPLVRGKTGNELVGPEILGSVISRLFAARGYGRPQADTQLAGIWREIAGERIASQTRVLGLKNGVLSIGVATSPLLSELSAFHREHLLEQLKARQGTAIRELRFRRSPRSV
jgi:predicted nucleic acid-binding Zn ribbon protein